MRKIAVILCFVTLIAQGQRLSLPSQIDRNLLYINPAYAGFHEASVVSLMHRSQWVNIPGALSFQSFEFHTPLKKQAVALGIQARHETIGLQDNTELFITYAHRIRFDNSILSLALKGGGQNKGYKEADLGSSESYDPAFSSQNSIIPNVGFGLSYYSKNYFVGVSVPYFFSSLSNTDGSTQLDFNSDNLTYILSAGGSIGGINNLRIEPQGALFYSQTLKPQITAILNFKYMEKFLLGAGYRLDEGIIANIGYFLSRQFSIAYSYDYNLGEIGASSGGTHEIGILYYFGYKVNTLNPRDF